MIILWYLNGGFAFFEAWKLQLLFTVIALKNTTIILFWTFSFVLPESSNKCLEQHEGCVNDDKMFIFGRTIPFSDYLRCILEHVSCSWKMLSTGFPIDVYFQVIESMWTISWLCTYDTEEPLEERWRQWYIDACLC